MAGDDNSQMMLGNDFYRIVDFRSGNAAFHEMLITDDTKKILSKYDQTGYASDH